MTKVVPTFQPGEQLVESPLKETAYRWSKKFLTGHFEADRFFSRKLANLSPETPFKQRLFKALHTISKQITTQDNVSFHPSRFMRFTESPIGAKLIILYLGLIYPRAARAFERAPLLPDGTKDYREVWDVFRRDVWAITVFIYGLGSVSKKLNLQQQLKTGLKLTKADGELYTFQDHAINARIRHQNVFRALLTDTSGKGVDHGKALIEAANKNSFFGVPRAVHQYDPALTQKLEPLILAFRNTLNTLKGKTPEELSKPENKELVKTVSRKATLLIQQLDNIRAEVLEQAGDKARKLEKRWGRYEDFYSDFAKTRRAPLDLYTFLLVMFLIGFGPVWVNRWITERQYRKEMDKIVRERLENNQAFFNPKLIFQQLKETSRLAPQTLTPIAPTVNPFTVQ